MYIYLRTDVNTKPKLRGSQVKFVENFERHIQGLDRILLDLTRKTNSLATDSSLGIPSEPCLYIDARVYTCTHVFACVSYRVHPRQFTMIGSKIESARWPCRARGRSSDHDFPGVSASFVRGRSVEYQLGYLSALHARAIRTLATALELEGDTADCRLGHAFLTEVAQLAPVEDRARRVEVLWLDLNRILEVHVERITGAVRKELGVVLGEHAAQPLQLDTHVVVGGTGRATVEAEADDEDALVDAELDRVAAASVAPLIRSVCARLESVTYLWKASSFCLQ